MVLRTQGQFLPWPRLLAHLEVLRAESFAGGADRIRAEMKEIVPQYQWQQTDGKVEMPAEMHQASQLTFSIGRWPTPMTRPLLATGP